MYVVIVIDLCMYFEATGRKPQTRQHWDAGVSRFHPFPLRLVPAPRPDRTDGKGKLQQIHWHHRLHLSMITKMTTTTIMTITMMTSTTTTASASKFQQSLTFYRV